MRKDAATTILCLAGGLLGLSTAHAQRAAVGNWTAPGNDSGHSGWQRAESTLTVDAVPSQFKLLWKIKLGNGTSDSGGFTEPLLAPRLINAQGFKDFVYVASPDTLYAVDSELGTILWTKHYDTAKAPGACGAVPLGMAMEPPQVINFGARRTPGAPLPPAPPPPPKPTERKLGGGAGAGGFTLRGIYILTGDGMLHEQVLTTGVDYAAPVKFLQSSEGGPRNLNIVGKTVYTLSGGECAGEPNTLSALDMTNSYAVQSYKAGNILDVMGPAVEGGNAILITGEQGEHANSIVAVNGKDLTAASWYTPQGKLGRISPIAFAYKGKQLVAGPGPEGTVVLLDQSALGGSDHHTALAQTEKVFTPSAAAWGALSVWADNEGVGYLYVSISDGPRSKLWAFRMQDQDGKISLVPAWHSDNLTNPSPAVIGNGVLAALAEGDAKTHATLLVMDAKTGKQLFSSGQSIPTYAHLSGLAMGDGHVFFTTHDNTLYSFGIGIEH